MRKVLTSARRRWRVRSALSVGVAGALAASLGVALLGATTVQVSADEPCVAKEAWTEISGWVATSPGADWYEVDRRVIPGTDPVPEIVEYEYVRLTKPAVEEVTENVDQWYSYNPAVDVDGDVTTGYPVGDTDLDKANGWQVNQGDHTGQYDHENFAIGVPWLEGSGHGSWFFVSRTVVIVTPGSDAEYEYVWALESPGEDWEPTGESRIVQDYVPGTNAVTEYRFAFDHLAVTCEIAGEEVLVPEPAEEPMGKPDTKPTVKGAEAVAPPAAVPTAVAAGLTEATGSTTAQLLGQGLVAAGLLILVGAGRVALRARPRGARLS